MFVSCECCVLSGRGLCVGPVTSPEGAYRVRCNQWVRWRISGSKRSRKKKYVNYEYKYTASSWLFILYRRNEEMKIFQLLHKMKSSQFLKFFSCIFHSFSQFDYP